MSNNTIYFANPGVIDVEAMTTFGVSVKETDNPIGFFGTGFKYALAILLRNNHTITVYAGKKEYRFTTVTKHIRNKPFDFIAMNDTTLGFTTELGKTWEMWQAYREIYCNTKDENGTTSTTPATPNLSNTVIVVEGSAFYEVHENRHNIILESDVLYETGNINVHAGATSSIFFKTIKVHDSVNGQYMHSYSFNKDIDLTEDRTLKHDYQWSGGLNRLITNYGSYDLVKAMITAPKGYLENKIVVLYNTPSETFLKVMDDTPFDDITNMSAIALYNEHTATAKRPATCELSKIEEIQLKKAVMFCKHTLNCSNLDRYPINISDSLHDDVLGMAYEKEIFISRRVFKQGTKQVTATLLEEYLHLDQGFVDETYNFQTYLFDVIVSLGEEVNGEPL